MRAADLFRDRSKGFLVIGRAGMDFMPTEQGVRAEDCSMFAAGLGGSSANIAAGLCKQGCAAAIVTPVSDDLVGRFCVKQLERYGVDTRFVSSVGGEYRNSLAVYDLQETVIYRNGAADFQLTEEDVAKRMDESRGRLRERIVAFHTEETKVAILGEDRILVEVPGVRDIQRVKK